MAIYNRILTKEEKSTLKMYREEYREDEKEYNKRVEDYLEEIHYTDRMADYLKNKWYFKLLIFILKKLGLKRKEE
jgi:hypothetical protein